jgi:DegV family protein with EDD domain
MPETAIVTDSTSDLPSEIVRSLEIEVVPAVVTIDGESHLDGLDLSRQEFYRRLPSLREPATTAAPPPGAFESAYRGLLSRGARRILSLHVSSKLSGLINMARQAAKAVGEQIHVFDSLQVSLGLGFQVMEAATAALRNEPFEAIEEAARRARDRVKLVAMIDTLEFLRRSGRVSWIRAGIGDLLRVKLLVGVADGVVQRLGEVRTKHKALDQLIALAETWGPLERLAVLHSGAPEEAAAFAERSRHLSSRLPLVVDVTTAIGTHVGPGAIGLAALSR